MKEVKSTKDYKQFKKLVGNRGVSETRIQKIIHSVKKVGYITSPIIVNEKMEVIDGQGRLEAFERLGIPVEYIVQNGIGIDECVSMNIHQTNWTIIDYITSHAVRGNENYIRLLKLKNEYPELSINVLAPAVKGIGRFQSFVVSQGKLIVTEEEVEQARVLLDYVMEIFPYIKNLRLRREYLIQSIIFTLMIEEVDKTRLFDKLKNESNLLRPFHSINECMQSLEELYNYGLHKKVFIFTEYRVMTYNNVKKAIQKYNEERIVNE